MPVPARKISPPPVRIDFEAIRRELKIPDGYPEDALAEARQAASAAVETPHDDTAIPFVTIDPPGSMDLDQAVHLERSGDGYIVHYAIADVASFVRPGGPLDQETHRRGLTFYSPDTNTPLHPRELSEGAASLLPDQTRIAVLWTITLDAQGEPVGVDLRRTKVRSIARLDYPGVQADLEAGRMHPSIELLPEIGKLRQEASRRRHAITLDLPDSEVTRGPDDRWTLTLRAIAEVEKYNAEISLLTGMSAAAIMLDGGIGLLRTLPPPDEHQIRQLRTATKALGIEWPEGTPPGDVIAGLDGSQPRDAAFLEDAVRLLRGAGYTPFQGTPPEQPGHGGVGAPYAHVTAPLRRLADRYATEICLALVSKTEVPQWVTNGMAELPDVMAGADKKADELERDCAGAVAAFLLHGREGEEFDAVVLQVDRQRDRATVILEEPPVRAHCAVDGLTEGSKVRVRLESADPNAHRFVVALVG